MEIIANRSLPAGAYCDLVTPFHDGRLDIDALQHLVRWQIESGIAGIVVCGQAGEATSLTADERASVIAAAIQAAGSEVPILVGTGTNATASTIEFTQWAERLGANAAVVVTPYYSKPPQEGVFRHVEAVAASVDLPIIICNAPDRTASDLSPRSIERLRNVAGIVGLADCSGDIGRLSVTRDGPRARFRYFSGHDLTALAHMLSGGSGTLSVAANVAPRLVAAMHVAIATGNIDAATTLNLRLRPLMQLFQREPAPAVAKQALQFVVGIDPEVRLPLTAVEPETAAALRLALSALPHQGIRRLAL